MHRNGTNFNVHLQQHTLFLQIDRARTIYFSAVIGARTIRRHGLIGDDYFAFSAFQHFDDCSQHPFMDPTCSFWVQGKCLIIHNVNWLRLSNGRRRCYLAKDSGFCTHNATHLHVYLRRTLQTREDQQFKTSNFILPHLVDILCVFCGFRKSLEESECLKSIAITYRSLPTFFLRDRNLHYKFSNMRSSQQLC